MPSSIASKIFVLSIKLSSLRRSGVRLSTKRFNKKTSASKFKTDASKQNEKPTLNKSFYALNNHPLSSNVA